MSSALFVVSEHGYWGEECIEPLTTLSDAGLDITVATPTGEPPVLDERSVDPEEVGEDLSEHVREVHETDERLNNPIPLAQADAEDYDTVVFPGGHGAEWDITQDTHARELLRESVAGGDGKALVVCHTVGILAFTRDTDGEFLVDGRSVTGFPNAWEEDLVDENDRLPGGRKLPYGVEDEVRAAGGKWDGEPDAAEKVLVAGDLITARGPHSSSAAADTLLSELGGKHSADE